jgi:hypothetical protein
VVVLRRRSDAWHCLVLRAYRNNMHVLDAERA